MRLRRRVTTAGEPADGLEPDGSLPPERPVAHWTSLLWWLALVIPVAGIYWREFLRVPMVASSARSATSGEQEAFCALLFGKLSASEPEAISPAILQEDLLALREAGYHAIGLDEVREFLKEGTPLPEKPVLLTFSEAGRETVEIADPLLAATGMRATVFVTMAALEQGNVELTSRHRLGQLAHSGRWDVGLVGCPRSATDDSMQPASFLSAEEYRRQRETLGSWLDDPIMAVDCQQSLAAGDSAKAWTDAVQQASFSLGFLHVLPRANYVDESPWQLRRLRVLREWKGAELVSRLSSYQPRHEPFVDQFSEPELSTAWRVDRGDVSTEDGSLRLSTRSGETGALLALGGTERWNDAEVEVELAERPSGQFWVSLRDDRTSRFLRLGVVGGQAVLQRSDAEGQTRQAAAQEIEGRNINLRLRIAGSRALAYAQGQPLADRPAPVPSGLESGPLTLAVWSSEGEASARIRRVRATPLPRVNVLVAAVPSSSTWDALRQKVTDLSAVSPRYFVWEDGRLREAAGRDEALPIFAHYHFLQFLPALAVEGRLSAAQRAELVEQVLHRAREPVFDGLNLVIDSASLESPGGRELANGLRQALQRLEKELVVTVVDPRETKLFTPESSTGFVAARIADRLLLATREQWFVLTGLGG